jgi:hypothetical protein
VQAEVRVLVAQRGRLDEQARRRILVEVDPLVENSTSRHRRAERPRIGRIAGKEHPIPDGLPPRGRCCKTYRGQDRTADNHGRHHG